MAHVPVHNSTRPSVTYNSDAPYQTRSWSFCALCFLPTPSCCLPAISIPVLTGELSKTAIWLYCSPAELPDLYMQSIHWTFFILHKCYICIVPLLLVRNKNLCLMSYVLCLEPSSYLVLIFFVNTQMKIRGDRKESTMSECGHYVAVEALKIAYLQIHQDTRLLPAQAKH